LYLILPTATAMRPPRNRDHPGLSTPGNRGGHRIDLHLGRQESFRPILGGLKGTAAPNTAASTGIGRVSVKAPAAAALARDPGGRMAPRCDGTHLAGAIRVPVWTLLPYCPDYRWKLDHDDSPWYRSVRLYRRQRPGGRDSVIQRIRGDLMRPKKDMK
jgi:hypothetical protein